MNAEQVYLLTVLFYVGSIGYQYLIPISNIVGMLLNTVTLIVLFNPTLKGHMYKYLIAKTIIEMLTQFSSAMTFLISCERCGGLIYLYSTRVIKIVFLHYGNSFAYTMASIVEISMSYDRLRIFNMNSRYLMRINFNYLIILTVSFSALVNIPLLFSRSIINIAHTSAVIFTDIPSEFGQSTAFTIYVNMMNVIQAFVPLIALTILNTLVAIEFRKYLNRNKNLRKTNNHSNLSRSTNSQINRRGNNPTNEAISATRPNSTNSEIANKKFTLMILITSSLFTLTRLYNSGIFVWTQILNSTLAAFNGPYLIFTYFGFQFLYFYFASNIFIYIACNRNFKNCFIRLICCRRN
jgi:hypothetical protein